MNVKAANWVEGKNDELIRSAQQASGSVHESLMRRLLSLLDATMRETWLPMGFRALVVQEFPLMRKEVERGRGGEAKLSALVAHLVEEAEPYKVFAERSEALLALRLLSGEARAFRQIAS